VISSEQIGDAISSLRGALDERIEAKSRIGLEVQQIERELALLIELGRLRGLLPEATNGELPIENLPAGVPTAQLSEVVITLLKRRGQPMHIQDLVAAVRGAGAAIPGRGEPANLITHIRTHPEIVRPVRGMYGLREWGLSDGASAPRRRRRRRVMKAR